MGRLSSSLALLFWLLISCTDDQLPNGLYGYQVTRLMTHDSSKVWHRLDVNESGCDEAYFFLLEKVDDSISLSEIRFNCASNLHDDTVYWKKGIPSTLGLDFTDSINWDDGSHWIIQSVTESEMSLYTSQEGEDYSLIN